MPTTTANSRPRRSGILSATSNKSTWLERSVKSSKHFRRKEVTFIFQGFPGYKCPEPDCPAVPFCLSYLDLHLQSAHGKAEPPEKVDVKNLPESGKTSPPKRVSAINRKSPTPPPPQQQIIAKVKNLPALSCVICKQIFSTQMFLKSHMKDKHKMSNEKINQVLCKIWLQNNKSELSASPVSPPSNSEVKQLTSKDSEQGTPGQCQSSNFSKENSSCGLGGSAVLNIAEDILGSINNFLLGSNEQTYEDMVSLDESVKVDSKVEMLEELNEVKVEESNEEKVEPVRVDWVEEVEKGMMSAGSLFHCSECKFNNKEENKMVEHIQTNHLPSFPGYCCPVVKCQVQTRPNKQAKMKMHCRLE